MSNKTYKNSSLKEWGALLLKSAGIGSIICTACILFMDSDGVHREAVKIYMVWIGASALYGIATKEIMFSCRMNLLLSTIIHGLICFAVTVVGWRLCSFEETTTTLVLEFLIIYAIIYMVCFLSSKNEAKKINSSISRNDKDEE